MFLASSLFIFFGIVYILGVALCVWQERELSLPHEKAVRMNVIIVALSVMLFAMAIYSFLNIDWRNLFIFRT